MNARLVTAILVAVACLACGVFLWLAAVDQPAQNDRQANSRRSIQNPPTKLVGLDGYIGSAACAVCHLEQHQSYLRTSHSRSLSLPPKELQTQSFDHAASLRKYQVATVGNQILHREWQAFGPSSDGTDDKTLLLGEYPVKYVVGSGTFAHSYLLADGDYLIQSPLTWYRATNRYEMSPGYDVANHLGFTRTVNDQCLFCHAGQVSRQRGNPNWVQVHELAIGCERCHGPGADHSEYHRRQKTAAAPPEAINSSLSMFHPGKSDRQLVDSICAQCHCQGNASANAPGINDWDFRPGNDFAAIKMNYDAAEIGNSQHRFVGHFAQMRQSKCYHDSESLTCITCHNPHRPHDQRDDAEVHRDQCQQCHSDNECSVDIENRMAKNDNQCVLCHMPTGDSEVPHVATTNHRIAIYDEYDQHANNEHKASEFSFIPLQAPDPNMTKKQLARSRAVALTSWLLNTPKGQKLFNNLAPGLAQELNALVPSAQTDPGLLAAAAELSRAYAERLEESDGSESAQDDAWNRAVLYAQRVTAIESNPTELRAAAIEVIAHNHFRCGRFAEAVDAFGQLVLIRRNAPDFFNLGLCLGRIGEFSRSEFALLEAIRIDGVYAMPYRSLAILLSNTRPDEAKRFEMFFQQLTSQREPTP